MIMTVVATASLNCGLKMIPAPFFDFLVLA